MAAGGPQKPEATLSLNAILCHQCGRPKKQGQNKVFHHLPPVQNQGANQPSIVYEGDFHGNSNHAKVKVRRNEAKCERTISGNGRYLHVKQELPIPALLAPGNSSDELPLEKSGQFVQAAHDPLVA